MKKLLSTSILTLSCIAVQAATIYVDFGDDAGAITAGETYNTLVPTASGASTSLEGTGETFSNLLDTTGVSTGANLHVLVTSTGGDVRGGHSTYAHDPISGIDDNALNDGFWVNNGNDNGVVSFVLTFSSLGITPYNLQLTPGSGLIEDTTWSVTTGTGDASSFTFTEATDESGLATWAGVTPVGGEVVLTGSFNANSGFDTTTVNFLSITAVPEPSSTVLFGLGGLALVLRRRR